jgi:hypothetical protein
MVHTYRGFTRAPREAVRYVFGGHELDNFTYEIANREELATFIATALKADRAAAVTYIDELDDDRAFHDAIRARLASRRDRNAQMPVGRRLGWYVAARMLKPELVVETGVHDGLGSAVFLRALEKNAAEGVEGRLLSFDIRSDVGWLIPDELRGRHELVVGDSIARMPDAVGDRRVGLFLHDSDHRYQYETAEFETVRPLATPGAVLMSDNSHSCTALQDFCKRYGWPYSFFAERPVDHFYPGAGIGLTKSPAG